MVNLRSVDDLKTQISAIRDATHLKRIGDARKMGKAVWRPHHIGPVCIGCISADVHVVSVKKANQWSNYGITETNELSIYCYEKSRIIQKPYEICRQRKEKPKIPIDKWNFPL